jgi:hypothetical protein
MLLTPLVVNKPGQQSDLELRLAHRTIPYHKIIAPPYNSMVIGGAIK